MKYAYYPGCSLHSTAKEYDLSTQAVCDELGIELQEIPDWNCCGATSAHATNRELGYALPLRDLAKAESMGLDVVAPCAACFSRLKAADHAAKDNPELIRTVAEKTGLDYQGRLRIMSMLEVIAALPQDEIKSHVKRELTGLKPACYYGCLLTRPPKIAAFDCPEHPMSMDGIMTAVGAEPVEWPYKNECCGASLALSRSDIVVKLVHDILSMAKRSGANCIVTACPLCQANLDTRQAEAESKYGEQFGLPVFYFTQLLGYSFLIPKTELGMNRLMVDPRAVLMEIGVG